MKRFAILLCIIFCTALMIVSCQNGTSPAETTQQTTAAGTVETTPAQVTTTAPVTTTSVTTEADILLVEDSKPIFQVVVPLSLYADSALSSSLSELSNAFEELGIEKPRVVHERLSEKTYEILVGETNRKVALPEIGSFEWSVSVQGTKVLLYAHSTPCLIEAVNYFMNTYVKGSEGNVVVHSPSKYVGQYDATTSTKHNMTYADMATTVWNSFNDKYWKSVWVEGNWFWDTAETLEVYIDAYEQTKDEAIKSKMLKFADQFIRRWQKDFTWNEYNDDVMWICIAFSRITLLTGETKYYDIAKANFDAVYKRAYDTKLGGGLYWRIENNTKNSCVNCPASIAACLIGELSKDESYFEKAKGLMDWEFRYMYEKNTGKVYDAYNINGEINKWASTYNQGTFIGACTLLYKHYGDETYLTYADKAADYAMKELTTNGVLDNGENSGNDLPGFKGILTRWMYRYAKEVNDVDILLFLQSNADAAFANRNEAGLIWTSWHRQTPEDPAAAGHIVFSMTTAVALMYNCQPW
ncbi:MAG: hypothetical protein IJD35_02045 [Clostridia bacterium]|nr:hypothetical protein [Clostridia bacterium]